MTTPPPQAFASSADLAERPAQVEEIGSGVFAFTAGGDPNVGAILTDDGVIAIDARATPAAAAPWLREIRAMTDAPVRWLVLTHYHAVRALGASAFDAGEIVASASTAALIAERGKQDWESEFRRMPRLAADPETVPGLTWPTVTFEGRLSLHIGGRHVDLLFLGRGHTAGDIAVWLPEERVLFAGDLVEARAALYMGDAHVEEWRTTTLDAVEALGANALVPGRGAVVHGEAVTDAIAGSRGFLDAVHAAVEPVWRDGGSLKDAFDRAQAEMAGEYGDWAIFDHVLPFNVKRVMDELNGLPPEIWTAESDLAIWAELTSQEV